MASALMAVGAIVIFVAFMALVYWGSGRLSSRAERRQKDQHTDE